jgi:hypothetical protein
VVPNRGNRLVLNRGDSARGGPAWWTADSLNVTQFVTLRSKSCYPTGVFLYRETGRTFRDRRAVAKSLPYTVGSMVCEAHAVVASGVASAPTCGFHHAHYAEGQIAAIKLLRLARVYRVLLVDTNFPLGQRHRTKSSGASGSVISSRTRASANDSALRPRPPDISNTWPEPRNSFSFRPISRGVLVRSARNQA